MRYTYGYACSQRQALRGEEHAGLASGTQGAAHIVADRHYLRAARADEQQEEAPHCLPNGSPRLNMPRTYIHAGVLGCCPMSTPFMALYGWCKGMLLSFWILWAFTLVVSR